MKEVATSQSNTNNYRKEVGGLWEEMGKLQFDFLLLNGLKPNNSLLDIGCGSLRLGRLVIPYLNPEKYCGVDMQDWLIREGLEKELSDDVLLEKLPSFIVSDSFDFSNIDFAPDYIMAQSLFSHLNEEDILMCLKNAKDVSHDRTRFFATFFPISKYGKKKITNHHDCIGYTKDEITRLGDRSGWKTNYIGKWNHPRGQIMVEYYQ